MASCKPPPGAWLLSWLAPQSPVSVISRARGAAASFPRGTSHTRRVRVRADPKPRRTALERFQARHLDSTPPAGFWQVTHGNAPKPGLFVPGKAGAAGDRPGSRARRALVGGRCLRDTESRGSHAKPASERFDLYLWNPFAPKMN